MVGKHFDLHTTNEDSVGINVKDSIKQDYLHVFRKKTPYELFKLSSAVMGIELAYSVETAFVSPILLELGIEHEKMTLVWALSPILGLLLGPFLGSVSDKCRSGMGRRRPLIICLFIGLFCGLIFVPYGKEMGRLFGDGKDARNGSYTSDNITFTPDSGQGNLDMVDNRHRLPIFAVVFTILGTILMDFNADVSQSPIRAYLLEVCLPEDHGKGLSLFTVTTGIGGFLGYLVGAIDWEQLIIGKWLGGNVKTVFLIIIIISTTCVFITITSFKEIPLPLLEEDADKELIELSQKEKINSEDGKLLEGHVIEVDKKEEKEEKKGSSLSLAEYCKSLISMPMSLKILSFTNFLIWMSHLSYSLYFTDFVGECVFGGDPAAPSGSEQLELYNSGVRFGCWGLALYCLSCAVYSAVIDRLIKKFGTKPVFVGGLLVFSVGMGLLAVLQSKAAVLVLSVTAGIDYSTLSTIPYLILAEYHTQGRFDSESTSTSGSKSSDSSRGLGMDMAIMGSTIFAAQLSLSVCLGWLVQVAGGASVVLWSASILSTLAAISATQVTYLD